MDALAPIIEQAQGTALEHTIDSNWAAKRLATSTPALLILVHPLPDNETIGFWQDLEKDLQSAMPLTVVVAPSEELLGLEPLRDLGVRLVDFSQPAGELESALLSFLCKARRLHARVMVNIAVELGSGKILRIAQTVNVSRSGLLIRTRERFPAGSTLHVKMELPGNRDPIEARAEVVRVTDPEVEDVHGIGARFVWFRGGDEQRFDEFVRRALIDSASASPA